MYDGLLQETLEACPYQVNKEKAEAHLSNYVISDLSQDLATVQFDEIDLSEESKSYLNAVLEVKELLLAEKGAYIYGNMGTGKTYLAACAANETAMNNDRVVFVHYPAFCQRLSATLKTGEYRKTIEQCGYVKLLVLDDIGAEDVTERNRAVLLSILDERMKNHRMTWFTANADFDTLHEHFLATYLGNDTMQADRIMERIKALATPVYLDGPDRRILSSTE